MVRRLLASALMTIAVLVALQSPAWAQGNSQGNGNSGEHGNSEGKGNSDNAGSSSAGGNSNSQGAAAKADEDLALEAVRAANAVSLERILEGLRQSTSGRVIDAMLFSRNGVLVYEVKVLSKDGRVTRYYYDAGSGKPYGSN